MAENGGLCLCMCVDDRQLGRLRRLRQHLNGANGNPSGAAHQRTHDDHDGDGGPESDCDAKRLRYSHSIADGNQHPAPCSHPHINANRDPDRCTGLYYFTDICEHVATNRHGDAHGDYTNNYSNKHRDGHINGHTDSNRNPHVN